MDVIAAIMWLLLVGITIFAIISLKGGSGGTTNPSQLSPYVELVYHDLQKQLNSAGYSLRDIRELEINSLNIEITTDGVNSHGSRCYKSFFVTKFADLGFTISSWDSEYKEYLFLKSLSQYPDLQYLEVYATRWWHDDDKYQINGDEVTLVKGSSGEYFVNIRDAQIYPDKICTKHHIYEMGQMRFSLRRKEVVQAEVDKLEKENRIRTI